MSLRQLKKATKAETSDSTVDVTDEVPVNMSNGPRSAFVMLDDGDDSDSDNSDLHVEKPGTKYNEWVNVEAPTSAAATRKSKKTKKKAKKKDAGGAGKSACEPISADLDDLDEILPACVPPSRAEAVAGVAPASSSSTDSFAEMLQLNAHELNEVNELKRQFGAKIIDSDLRERRAEGKAAGRRRGRGGGGGPLLRNKKGFLLLTPDDSFGRAPPRADGLGMKLLSTDGPVRYYELEPSELYTRQTAMYEACVATYDPNHIVDLLRRHPFHVQALLQLAEVLQAAARMEEAADLVRRALFVLELALHPSFDLHSGQCRLLFSCANNRPMFRALGMAMKAAGRKGCLRTAGALARLVYSLDPVADPLAAALYMDFYLLQTRQYELVMGLSEWRGASRGVPLAALPNMLYARALALLRMGASSVDPQALAAMRRAVLAYPGVLRKLASALDLPASDPAWREVLAHGLLVRDEAPLLEKLAELYAARQAELWAADDARQLLLRGASSALASMDCGSEAVADAVAESLAAVRGDAAWREMEGAESFMAVTVSELSDAVQRLPDDPWLHPGARARAAGAGEGAADEAALRAALEALEAGDAAVGNLDAGANPLLLFLQTMLPWNHL